MRSKNYGINVRVTEQEKQKLLENARFCSRSERPSRSGITACFGC